jgi:hypothetical protein
MVFLLYEISLQSSGFNLEDPSKFTNRILKLIDYGLGYEEDNEIPEITITTNDISTNMEETD